jgi:hypothetical protein
MKFIRETRKELTAEDTEITERELVSHERESCAKLEEYVLFSACSVLSVAKREFQFPVSPD